MSWATILTLAAGAYLFKLVGFVIVGSIASRSGSGTSPDSTAGPDRQAGPSGAGGVALRIGALLPPALLAALVVSQTVVADTATGTTLTIDARLVGVAAGAFAVWRWSAPFWLVLVISAATTAAVRLVL